MLSLLLVTALSLPTPAQGDEAAPVGLTVIVADVGQGLAVVLRTPDGTVHVFDGGPGGTGSGVVVPLVRSLLPRSYGSVLLSHYHVDHSGGMNEVLNVLPFPVAWDRGDVRASGSGYSSYVAAAGSRRRTPTAGQTLALGGGVAARVVAINGEVPGYGTVPVTGGNQEENARSVALRIDYGRFSLWFGGDLTGGGSSTPDVESTASLACGDVDVCVVDHHGSVTSTNDNLWTRLAPELALVSCGADNSYGHPHNETINKINSPARLVPLVSTTVGVHKQGYGVGSGPLRIDTDGERYRLSIASGEFLDFFVDEVARPLPVAGEVVFSELMRDPGAASDTYGEYMEFTAVGRGPVTLRGMSCVTTGGAVTFGTTLALFPGRPLLFARDGEAGRNGRLPFGLVWPFGAISLGNSGGSAELRAGSAVIDGIGWGSGPPGGPGVAAERRDLLAAGGSANFASATRPFGDGDLGSPAMRNATDSTRAPAQVAVETAPGRLVVRGTALSSGGTVSVLALAFTSQPGFPLLGAHVPLNPDGLFALSVTLPGFVYVLPTDGYRSVILDLPQPSGLTGAGAFAAHLAIDFGAGSVRTVSGAQGFVFP